MKTIIYFLLILLVTNKVVAQDDRYTDFNYYDIVKLGEENVKRVKNDTTDKKSKYLTRWKFFWKDRLDKQQSLLGYSKALKKEREKRCCASDCTNCCFLSNWQYLGPKTDKQSLGKVNTIWSNPLNRDFILLGSEGGLWKTKDQGLTWECITDFCFPGIGITDIDANPQNPDEIFVSTGHTSGDFSFTSHNYGYGILYTLDGGKSWNEPFGNIISDLNKKFSRKVILHPSNPDIVYGAVGHEIFKSIDKGISWVKIFGTINELQIHDLALISSTPNDNLIVSTKQTRKCYTDCTDPNNNCTVGPEDFVWGCQGCSNSIMRNGKIFTLESNSLNGFNIIDLSSSSSPILPNYNSITSLSTFSITDNYINIASQTNYNGGQSNCSSPAKVVIYRKPINGGSWSLLNTYTVQPGWMNAIKYNFDLPFAVSNSNPDVIYFGGNFMNKSINAGGTYSVSEPSYWIWLNSPNFEGSHPDVRCLELIRDAPSGNDVLLFGTDGGLSKTINGCQTTSNLNGDGLQLTQFFGMSNSESLPHLINGGTQDNGYYSNYNPFWINYPYGDAYRSVTSKSNPEISYTTFNGNNVREMTSTFNGLSLSQIGCPQGYSCNGETALFLSNSNSLYVGTKELYKYTGSSWQQLTNSVQSNSTISEIEISDDETKGIVVYGGPTWGGTVSNKILLVDNLNSSPSVTDLSIGLNQLHWKGITSVCANSDFTVIFVSLGNVGGSSEQVLKYENGSWTNYGQGLPGLPVNDIEFYRAGIGILFAALDNGVYYRDNNMNEWKRFSCQLPKTLVSDLELNYEHLKLRASTYSRGIWETTLPILVNESNCKNEFKLKSEIVTQVSEPEWIGNNQIIFVKDEIAGVNITLEDYCDGCDCCNDNSDIAWEIYRNGSIYSVGDHMPISFIGLFFKKGGWFSKDKFFTYEVFIYPKCNGINCNTIHLVYKGIK